MKKRKIKHLDLLKKLKITFIIFSLVFNWFLAISVARAGTLTTASDVMNKQVKNQTSGTQHIFIFTTAGAASGGAGANLVIVQFPDADDTLWVRAVGAGNDCIATGNTLDSATSLPGTLVCDITQGAGASSYDTITITGVNDLSAATKYAVKVVEANDGDLGTPNSTGKKSLTVKTNNGTTDVDTATVGVYLVTTEQTVSVTATVDEHLTLAVTGATAALSTLSTSSITTNSNAVFTVSTNIATGYVTSIYGATLATNGYTINGFGATETASVPGTEQFGLKAAAAGGSGAVQAPFSGTGYAFVANTPMIVGKATSTSETTTYTLTFGANITTTTEAGSYATTITVTAAGIY